MTKTATLGDFGLQNSVEAPQFHRSVERLPRPEKYATRGVAKEVAEMVSVRSARPKAEVWEINDRGSP